MWLKKTKVKTMRNDYVYLQLMESRMVDGKSKQTVLSNLGRADKVNMAVVNHLLERLGRGVHMLPPEEMALLPAKDYGVAYLLERLFNQYQIKPFLQDVILRESGSSSCYYTLFALIAYYLSHTDGKQPFFAWLNHTYLPHGAEIDYRSIKECFSILAETPELREGMLSIHKHEAGPGFVYLYRCSNTNVPLKEQDEFPVVFIQADKQRIPKEFRVESRDEIRQFLQSQDGHIFVCDEAPLLHTLASHSGNLIQYICKIDNQEMDALLNGSKDATLLLDDGDEPLLLGEMRCLMKNVDAHTLLLFWPNTASGEPSAGGPCDMFVTNTSLPPEEILRTYQSLERYQNFFYDIFVPEDLLSICRKLSTQTLVHAVMNCCFLRFFFLDMIERRVSAAGLTAQDVLFDFEDLVAAELNDGINSRVCHSQLTERHQYLFEQLGFFKPPTLS